MNIKIIIYSLLLSFLSTSGFAQLQKQRADKGMMDLSSYIFEEQGIITLDGNWEFYYNQLLKPGEFQGKECLYLSVPGRWTDVIKDNKELGSYGYATYRLRLKFSGKDSIYTLRMPRIDVAYKMWVNNKLLLEVGEVGTNKTSEKAHWFITNASFAPKKGVNEIVVQVSNFHHRKNGFSDSIELGTLEQIDVVTWDKIAFVFFILGLTIIMAVYHIGLFSLRTTDYSKLFFGLTAFFVSLHQLANNQIIITHIFSSISFETVLKVNFISNNLRVVFFVLFIYFSFKKEVNKYFVRVIALYGIIITAFILITTTREYTFSLILFEIIAIISIVYVLFSLITALINRSDGALYALLGTVVLLVASLNDMLHDAMIIRSFFAVPLGLFIFILFQSYMIALSSSRAFKRNEELSNNLNYVNKNLEKLVKVRTAEVEEQKEELISQSENLLRINQNLELRKKDITEKNKELKQKSEELKTFNQQLNFQRQEVLSKNQELKKQNEQILFQRNELEHRGNMLLEQKDNLEKSKRMITDSILYAKQIQKAILPHKRYFDRYFKDNFIMFKPRDIVSGDFYYIMRKGEKCIIFAAVDCTGHGVPGGFMSMLGIAYLNEITQKKEIVSTGAVLDELDVYVQKSLKQTNLDKRAIKDGMDVALCRLDLETNELQYSGAYQPLILIRKREKQDDEFVEIKGDLMPVGIFHNKTSNFTTHNVKLNEDDIIYLFSDGFSDQFGGANKRKYMSKNFKDKLYQIHELPMDKQCEELKNELERWKNYDGNSLKQVDDILVMGLKIDKAQSFK